MFLIDLIEIALDKKIPYVIGVGFNETAVDNIKEAVTSYNTIFANCISWVPKTNEVSSGSFKKKILYLKFANNL